MKNTSKKELNLTYINNHQATKIAKKIEKQQMAFNSMIKTPNKMTRISFM